MKLVQSSICWLVPRMPKQIVKYLKLIMSAEECRGRDKEYCSPYLAKKLNEYNWEVHNLSKPSLPVFSRWCFAICKKGLGKAKTRKSSAQHIKVEDYVKKYIIDKVEAIFGDDNIKDSFLGSEVFDKIFEEVSIKFPITISIFAEIIISKRKKTFSKSKHPTNVYFYRPFPSSPNYIKIGRSENPIQRMIKQCQNTATQSPFMIGCFPGTNADERLAKKAFSQFKIKCCNNKEMFDIPDLQLVIDYIKLHSNYKLM